MSFESFQEKIYHHPDGEEFETDFEEIADLLEGDEQFLKSSSRPAFVEGLYQEVKDVAVDQIYEEKNFNETGKDIGATSGLLGGGSAGTNGTDFVNTLIDIYLKKSFEVGQVTDALLPELSDPSLGGLAAGTVVGTVAGLYSGGKLADRVSGHYNRKQREIYEEKFAEELNNTISKEGWEEYRDQLRDATAIETENGETEEDY